MTEAVIDNDSEGTVLTLQLSLIVLSPDHRALGHGSSTHAIALLADHTLVETLAIHL